MSFTGIEFAFFFPLVFALYWLLPRRAELQNAFLLACSWAFYASWRPVLLPILIVATAVDYFVALDMAAHRDSPRRMRIALAISLLYNLGQLAWFKYAGFFAESLNSLLGTVGLGAPLPVLHILLPLGISFFTFQKLSYVLDVYWGRQEPCRSPLRFATFVAFFPQLIAGPIVRADELLPQLEQPRRLAAEKVASGAAQFFLGYIKKAYIGDLIGTYVVDPAFLHPERYGTVAHWIALFGYAAQVFCDFAGYSDMAIGCARTLGLELPQNFNYPFLSRTLIEFWRRWHITLNRWLFDYIYNPIVLGEGRLRGQIELGFLVVFLASGLWHGPKWTFVTWGFLHAIGLIVHHRWDLFYKGLCRKDRKWVARRKSAPYVAIAWFATQFFFVLTLVPFRAPTLRAAGEFARALVVPQHGLTLDLKNGPPMFQLNLLACVAFLVIYHLLELGRGRVLRDWFFRLPAPARGVVYGLVVVFLLLFVPISRGTFIYAQF